MSILIVDDSPDDLHLLQSLLSNAGYEDTLIADSAAAAFRLLGLDGGKPSPHRVDLILMDIVMPSMSPAQEASWQALLDLYEAFPNGWTLIGGQMVHLHCGPLSHHLVSVRHDVPKRAARVVWDGDRERDRLDGEHRVAVGRA